MFKHGDFAQLHLCKKDGFVFTYILLQPASHVRVAENLKLWKKKDLLTNLCLAPWKYFSINWWHLNAIDSKYTLTKQFIRNTCIPTYSCDNLISQLCGSSAMRKIMQMRVRSLESGNSKTFWIHQPLTCINAKNIPVHFPTFQTQIFTLASELFKLAP